MVAHPALWASPQPLWGRFLPAPDKPASFTASDQARPAILRFKSDDFMEQLLAILAADPSQLGEAIARPETWRHPSGELPVVSEPAPGPRLARVLKRMRASAAAKSPLDASADVSEEPVNGVQRKLPLKLYHPAHQRHYLVAAHLVCGIPGFPDKGIATGGREQVGFVLRRLLPPAGNDAAAPTYEYAFVKDARGPHWQLVPPENDSADPYAHAVDREETLPLFPLVFRDDVEHPRRLLAGIIPVGRREEYIGSRRYEMPLPANTAQAPGGAPPTASDPRTKISARKEQLKLDVTEPWKALIRAMYKAADRVDTGTPDVAAEHRLGKRRDAARQANEGAQMQSWLILLDFADYLAHHVPSVWAAVIGSASVPTLPDAGKQNLFNWINNAATASSGTWQLTGAPAATGMRDALKRMNMEAVRTGLEGAERTFVAAKIADPSWPKFYYLLAGVHEESASDFHVRGVHTSLQHATAPAPDAEDVEALPQTSSSEEAAARVDKLVQLVVAALDVDAKTEAPPVPFAAQLRDAIASMPADDPGWFTLRCVYVRCDCGPLKPSVFSAPSQRFQLASFFDSDAPARPIRIALPIDTTAAGLRKHQKSTAFILSDALCGQVNRLKGLGFVDLVLSVLPWPFHKDLDIGSEGMGPCKSGGNNLGMICSLSIPIITICALILLMMIVLVLDLIFKWIPWFIICWPLPGFKAKKAAT